MKRLIDHRLSRTVLPVGLHLSLFALAATTVFAQPAAPRLFYFPKPVKATVYDPPMKPIVRLADLKAEHSGRANWKEVVIDDINSHAEVISAPPGTKIDRHLHPDSPHWWVIQQGRARIEVEKPSGGYEVIQARKGSYVFAPERHLHSLQVIGEEPAIWLDVTLAQATPVFETRPSNAEKGIEYLPVTLQTGPSPMDLSSEDGRPDRLHANIEDLESVHRGRSSWSEPAMRKNRVRGNFIYGHARDNPKLRPGERGHFHADFAEFWIVMRGQLRWFLEGQPEPIVAGEGDIVYAPPKTFHRIEFYGDGPACRLTSSTYPNANHLYDAPH